MPRQHPLATSSRPGTSAFFINEAILQCGVNGVAFDRYDILRELHNRANYTVNRERIISHLPSLLRKGYIIQAGTNCYRVCWESERWAAPPLPRPRRRRRPWIPPAPTPKRLVLPANIDDLDIQFDQEGGFKLVPRRPIVPEQFLSSLLERRIQDGH